MDLFLTELRYSLRRILRQPGFALVAIISLGLGIGANIAAFSLVEAILLRESPVAEPARLVELNQESPNFGYTPFSFPEYVALVESTDDVFEAVSGSLFQVVPVDVGDRIESATVEVVTGNYFTVLGLQPHLGRLLGAEDHVAPGAHPVVVLSHDFWETAHGADPRIVGSDVRVNGRPYSVVGIAPESYDGNIRGIAPAMYFPIYMVNELFPTSYDQLEAPGNHSLFVTARLRPGVELPQVEVATQAFTREMQERYPDNWPEQSRIEIVRTSDIYVNPLVDTVVVPAGVLLLLTAGLVLLIACSNLASFLLARMRDRYQEVAIRLAIGAPRAVLIRQMLSEALLLALAGGLLGLLIARSLLGLLVGAELPLPIPITLDLSLNPSVVLFAIAVSLTAGLLFGLLPAIRGTAPDITSVIKSEHTGGGPRRRWSFRGALVIAQVAMSMILLITAGLLVRSLQQRQFIDPGFGRDPAAIVTFEIPFDRYPGEERMIFLREIEEQVRQIPGVRAVGAIDNLHLNSLSFSANVWQLDGVDAPPGETGWTLASSTIDEGFFEAVGMPLLAGRNFLATDDDDAPGVAIVNQAMADQFWPGESPLGRTIRNDDEALEVVGVVGTAKVRTLGEPPRPVVYQPYAQETETLVWLTASTTTDPERLIQEIVQLGRAMDPDLPVLWTRTMESHLATVLLPARLGAMVVAGLAMLALLLTVVGVYGIVSYLVSSRHREIGIRMAIGAAPGSVVRMLVSSGLRLVAVGAILGLLAAVATSGLLGSLLYGVAALDPTTFAVIPILLLIVAGLASYLPARRATRVDPLTTMKQA